MPFNEILNIFHFNFPYVFMINYFNFILCGYIMDKRPGAGAEKECLRGVKVYFVIT